MLHEQINDCKPPEEPPFGDWYQKIQVGTPTIESVGADSITASVSLPTLEWFDDPATVHIRVSEVNPESLDTTVVESQSKQATEGETVTLSVSSLSSATEYRVQAVAEVEDEIDYSDSVTTTTD
jgi:hypothetical protein